MEYLAKVQCGNCASWFKVFNGSRLCDGCKKKVERKAKAWDALVEYANTLAGPEVNKHIAEKLRELQKELENDDGKDSNEHKHD